MPLRPAPALAILLLLSHVGFSGVVFSPHYTSVNVLWSDNFAFDRPLTNSVGDALAGDTPFQVGYFAGIPNTADPADFGPDEWRTFTPVAGEGSANPDIEAHIDPDFPGYFTAVINFSVPLHVDIPTAPDPAVLVALRFFDQSTVAGSGFFNTVTSGLWVMESARPIPDVPFPANADLDFGILLDNLVWQSGEDGAFSTALSLPEPSSSLLTFIAAGLLFRRRR